MISVLNGTKASKCFAQIQKPHPQRITHIPEWRNRYSRTSLTPAGPYDVIEQQEEPRSNKIQAGVISQTSEIQDKNAGTRWICQFSSCLLVGLFTQRVLPGRPLMGAEMERRKRHSNRKRPVRVSDATVSASRTASRRNFVVCVTSDLWHEDAVSPPGAVWSFPLKMEETTAPAEWWRRFVWNSKWGLLLEQFHSNIAQRSCIAPF